MNKAMEKYKRTYTILLIVAIAVTFALPGSALAGEARGGRIRVMSSKKNDFLHNKLTIDLVNGRSKYISLDNMVNLIKGYGVIEFSSSDTMAAKEILLKEVAYRMLKYHYLPRVGDKIRVHRQQTAFDRDAGIHPVQAEGPPQILIPLEVAEVADKNKLKTLYWSDLVLQISSAIEKMWLNRIRHLSSSPNNVYVEKSLLEAALLLRKKYIQSDAKESSGEQLSYDAEMIVAACERKLNTWLAEGKILEQSVSTVAEMLIRFIILSDAAGAGRVVTELNSLEGVDMLSRELVSRIRGASESVKAHNPDDYAAFAMLQSLLNDITDRLNQVQNENAARSSGVTLGSPKSRHSA